MIKSVLITGATDGIGLETALQLARDGYHVLVHGRSEAKARKTQVSLAKTHTTVTPVWGDFENLRDIAALAEQVTSATDSLDVLINNAGVYAKQRTMTIDGFELTICVNHFAPFLLTLKLLPLLKQAKAARIINVSSMTHSGATLDLNDLSFEHTWSSYDSYAASKLANILFTQQLATDLKRTPVTANSLHPGVIGTKLLRSGFSGGGASVVEGARTSVFLATSPQVANLSGKYFVNCRQAKSSKKSADPKFAAALWEASLHAVQSYI
ncbi:MAG: NAD(P)-dependent dehydrogenase (short-subunit alcohol dehydrogenase family) [Gammaproteobacteria bacterium]